MRGRAPLWGARSPRFWCAGARRLVPSPSRCIVVPACPKASTADRRVWPADATKKYRLRGGPTVDDIEVFLLWHVGACQCLAQPSCTDVVVRHAAPVPTPTDELQFVVCHPQSCRSLHTPMAPLRAPLAEQIERRISDPLWGAGGGFPLRQRRLHAYIRVAKRAVTQFPAREQFVPHHP